jgi:hypothetical protein
MTATFISTELRQYEAHAWCDRTFTARFIVTADSPEGALAKAKEQVHDEDAEECDSGYPWDTFTIEDMHGVLVASEEPPRAAGDPPIPGIELIKALKDLRECTKAITINLLNGPFYDAILAADRVLGKVDAL